AAAGRARAVRAAPGAAAAARRALRVRHGRPGPRRDAPLPRRVRPTLRHEVVGLHDGGLAALVETRRFLDECGQPSVMKPYDFTDLIAAIGKVAAKTD